MEVEDDGVEDEVCPHCYRDVHPRARTCPSCGASRRTPYSKWRSQREGHRNDLVIAGLSFLIVLAGIALVVNTISYSSRTSTVSTRPCQPYEARYPNC